MTLLPDSVSNTIVDIFGERGRDWIARLPQLRDNQLETWGLSVTGPPFPGGTHSYVVPVRREGLDAVLKLPVVDEENAAEATALHHYGGDGAVRLFDYDPDSKAILMERAIPGTALLSQTSVPREGLPQHRGELELACQLFHRLWRVPGKHPAGFPTAPRAAALARAWEREFPARSQGRIPHSLVATGVRACGFLSTPDGPEGLCNRDTHLGNIVAAGREPWLLIDPKPLLGERAVDAGFLILKQILTRPDARQAREAVAFTADVLGVERHRARAWAFVRAVDDACNSPDAFGPVAAALAAGM